MEKFLAAGAENPSVRSAEATSSIRVGQIHTDAGVLGVSGAGRAEDGAAATTREPVAVVATRVMRMRLRMDMFCSFARGRLVQPLR
jgi:hypothetical protein